MIKFFRTIRKQLLGEGNTGKYFKYAIGEILLVVIGILIALQINNWNEYRKERALEHELLLGVYHSIISDTSLLNQEYENFQRILSYADFIKQKFADGSAYEKKLDTAFAFISEGYNNEADYVAFDRLLSVGINIVQNDSISKLLNRYYTQSKQMVYIENYFENNKVFRQNIYPKYFKSYRHSVEVIPIDYEVLKTSSEFNIALDYAINDAKFFSNWSIRRKAIALRIISALEKELDLSTND